MSLLMETIILVCDADKRNKDGLVLTIGELIKVNNLNEIVRGF